MECLLVFALLMLAIITLPLLVAFRSRRSRRLNGAYRQLAARYRGTFRGAGWFGWPQVAFTHGGSLVLVRSEIIKGRGANRWHGPRTSFRIDWPDPQSLCEIHSPPTLERASPPQSLRVIATRSPEFDGRFRVYAGDPIETGRLLSDTVRWQLQKLRHATSGLNLRLQVARGTMQVELGVLPSAAELAKFVELAIELYDQALLTRSAGIEFVADEGAAQILEHVICQVCGEAIEQDLVFCRRCKTPHHRDCWYYTGFCSVFACRETQFEVPRVAPSPPDAGPSLGDA